MSTYDPKATGASGRRRSAPSRRARERVVVVGNGMAGFRFCQVLTSSPRARHELIVIGEEPLPAYDRLRLSTMLAARDEAPLLAPRRWYASRDIELITGDPIERIDRARRQVQTRSGRALDYDRLILATGARPVRPPIEGIGEPGVLTLRTEADARRLHRYAARDNAHVAVLGGGLLGVEAAAALRETGARVSILEAAPRLLPRHLDEACAGALASRLESRGILVRTGAQVRRIRRARSQGLLVALDSGVSIAADAVLVAAGVKPRDELARAAGLAVAERGGIEVDDRLRSSDPRIYAIGDCARHAGTTYGLVGPGYEMARVAADNAAGKRTKFQPVSPGYRLKVPGIDVAVLGEGASGGRAVAHRRGGTARALALSGRRVVGACAVGAWDDLPAVEHAIAKRRRAGRRTLSRFGRAGRMGGRGNTPLAPLPDSAIVCRCAGVSRGQISRAVAAGCSLAEVGARTGAGEVCGGCRPVIAQLCGQRAPVRPRRGLLALALVALSACGAIAAAPPALASRARAVADAAIAAGATRLATGFALLGLCAIALALPLVKRALGARGARLARHRALHAGIGISAAAAVVIHTGLHLGDNLNRLVMVSFLALLGSGAALAALTAVPGPRGRILRPLVAFAHVVVLWVLPVLLGFHIFTAFYF